MNDEFFSQSFMKRKERKPIQSTFNANQFLSGAGANFLNYGNNTMQQHLDAISIAMSKAIDNQWLSDGEIQEIKDQLFTIQHAGDAYKLQGKVKAMTIDPEFKKPDAITVSKRETQILIDHIKSLAEKIDMRSNESLESNWYVADDNGMSILFFTKNKLKLSTAYSREELKRLLLILGQKDPDANYFINLFNLKVNEDDLKAVSKKREAIEQDRAICDYLAKLPKLEVKPAPDFIDKKSMPVIQGSGQTVHFFSTDYIGTNGMGPCVAVILTQNGKAFVGHIDCFKEGGPSLGGQGGKKVMDANLSNFLANESLNIYLVGANQGGRQTVIDIFQYLRERGMHKNIRAANVLGHGKSNNVTVDVKTGEVFPGVRIPGL